MKSHSVANLPTLRELLAAGAHFGHRRERSTPAARKYTFVVRDGVCVIDLEETQRALTESAQLLEEMASQGKTVLFVGTKRQAQAAIKDSAEKAGMPYVSNRWLGGTLTNFAVIRKNIQRLIDIEQLLLDDKEAAKYTKRERLQMSEEAKKLHGTLDGILALTKVPDMVIVVDPREEATTIKEARRLEIPVMALCDTDANPQYVDHVIPANDDAPKTVELILGFLADAIVRGKGKVS